MNVKFEATPAEFEIIKAITDRALALLKMYLSPTYTVAEAKQTLMMDIEATHCNGCPLDLDGLLAAVDDDFVHDVRGIHLYLDRNTGQLTKKFQPRHVKKPVTEGEK